MDRGTICFTTVLGGLGHDQGTRPVLVIGRTELGRRTGETIVLPISHVEPAWSYPLSWPVPAGLLQLRSWVLVSRPRAALVSRLREPVALLGHEQLDEVVSALRQLVEDPGPRSRA
jgi:mRNA-degrading endonuclease toxin of MazEF toxin-antitoxin module